MEVREHERLLEGFPHRRLFVGDRGYDVGPYFVAASTFPCDYFCFLNSHSVILDEGWLAKLYRHCSAKGVGLVGATGSHGSWFSYLSDILNASRSGPRYRRLVRNLRLRVRLWTFARHFDPFPNHHIRTNGFMISGVLMGRISRPRIISKWDAYKFESAKDGLTKQITGMHLITLVVGKDGEAYEKEEWFRSNTFWQLDQGNLLIADNQTERYLAGDNDLKQHLSRSAWGDQANPILK